MYILRNVFRVILFLHLSFVSPFIIFLLEYRTTTRWDREFHRYFYKQTFIALADLSVSSVLSIFLFKSLPELKALRVQGSFWLAFIYHRSLIIRWSLRVFVFLSTRASLLSTNFQLQHFPPPIYLTKKSRKSVKKKGIVVVIIITIIIIIIIWMLFLFFKF